MELFFVAFALGLAHGLEADHLATVSVLVMRGAGARESALAGLRFGAAHVGVLLIAGTFAVAFNLVLTEQAAQAAEVVSGSVLLLLGLFCLFAPNAARSSTASADVIHAHTHEHGGSRHVHLHVHREGDHHGHTHLSFTLGGLFALGGARSVLLVGLPALNAGSVGGAALAVALFGLGIFVSMTLSGLVLARFARLVRKRGVRLFGWTTRVTGFIAAGIGGVWLVRSLVG